MTDLSAEEWRVAILERIQERVGRYVDCDLCGQINKGWRTPNGFVTQTTFRRCGIEVGPEDVVAGVWLVMIACSNCGNTKFLNAIHLGVDDLVMEAGRWAPE